MSKRTLGQDLVATGIPQYVQERIRELVDANNIHLITIVSAVVTQRLFHNEYNENELRSLGKIMYEPVMEIVKIIESEIDIDFTNNI